MKLHKKGLQVFLMMLLVIGGVISPNFSHGQSKAMVQKKYGLNPNRPLTERIINTSPEILQKFHDAGMSPTIHKLSKKDSLKVVNAFLQLPTLHQQILKDHLLGISFLDNMPNTALTATVNPDDEFPVFTITFRAEILKQDVSQWLTEKEMSYFSSNHPHLRLAIAAGNMDAILYVLLHESTHVVDGALDILGKGLQAFPQNIWVDRTNLLPSLTDTLTQQSRFRNGRKLIPIELAQQIYQSAAQKPFVSLYATSSWHEDLAEYLTVSHFTRKLKQPFQVIIYKDNKETFTYEPMKNPKVFARIELMNYFYKKT